MQPSKPRANLNQLRHQHYQPLISGGASTYTRSGVAPEESPSNVAGAHLPEIAQNVEQMEMFNGLHGVNAVNADLRQNHPSQTVPATAAKSQRQVNGRVIQENEIKLQEAI